jgi:LytS/YehU family sensor histidine kinase
LDFIFFFLITGSIIFFPATILLPIVDFIPLDKEIEMVKNYIELQNLRSVESDKIQLEIKGEIKGKRIAPLLFLPFIENSFKHGLKVEYLEGNTVKICENKLPVSLNYREQLLNKLGKK